MKKTIILLFLFSISNLFAAPGFFSLGYVITLAGSLPEYKIEKNGGSLNKSDYQTQSYFEGGIILQTAYNFILSSRTPSAITLGIDFGYHRDAFSFIDYNIKKKYANLFDSILVGGYLESTIYGFMLGVGGGVKIALGGNYRYDNIIELLNYSRLKDRFDDLYIPYIKVVVGYKFYKNYSSSSLSFYFNYDFPNVKVKGVAPDVQKLAAIDLGVQITGHFNFIEDYY